MLTNSDKLYSALVKDCVLSDHDLGTASLNCGSSLSTKRHLRHFHLDFRQFDLKEFVSLLNSADLNIFESNDVNCMSLEWSGKLLEALNKVTPMKCYNQRKKQCLFLIVELLDLIHQRKALFPKIRASSFQDDRFSNNSNVFAVKPTIFIENYEISTSILHVSYIAISQSIFEQSYAV